MSSSNSSFEELSDSEQCFTERKQASALRKGDFVLLKNQPCRIVEYSTSKPGKHGSAKVNFVGLEIFTGKKVVGMCQSTKDMSSPIVEKTEYIVLSISEDGLCSLVNPKNNEKREDLRIELGDLRVEIQAVFGSSEIMVTVLKAMGKEHVVNYRKMHK